MAREEKRIELKPVPHTEETPESVFRLEKDDASQRARPVRSGVPVDTDEVSHRLELPARADFESRTHQPGIEALIETEIAQPDLVEKAWEKDATHHRHIPWGWFVLLALILAGAAIWSLSEVRHADSHADKLRIETTAALNVKAEEDREASQLIDRIDLTIRSFFQDGTVAGRALHVRHPERVRPLMEAYYRDTPIIPQHYLKTKLLQSLTIDRQANYWMAAAEFSDHSSRNLILEILDNGEPKIDWETLVCHQPLKWDDYAVKRPPGSTFDFRVFVEADHFFSHEFANSARWSCFRLTALDSEETLYGYAKVNEETVQQLTQLLSQSKNQKISVILRLTIPEGLQSPRGVVIEKFIAPRWIYADPPQE